MEGTSNPMQNNINFMDHQQNLVSDSSSKQINQLQGYGKNFSQTQKPGNVPNASAAAYNEAAQNYMISIVQNVYVGGPSMGQTMPNFQMQQQISRSQNSTKKHIKASKRQSSEKIRQIEQNGPNGLQDDSRSKKQGINNSTKGNLRMSRGKSNSGMSTNQAAINHYLSEIQNTSNDQNCVQVIKKKKHKKTNQSIQRYAAGQHNQASTMNKFIKSGSKQMINQPHNLNQTMQKPFQALVSKQPDVAWIDDSEDTDVNIIGRTRTAQSMKRPDPEDLKHQLDLQIKDLKSQYGIQNPIVVANQGFSPLSQVPNPFQSPKSQLGRNDQAFSPGITHESQQPQQIISRNPNRSFNLTPGTATFNSANPNQQASTATKNGKPMNLQTAELPFQSRSSGKSKNMTFSQMSSHPTKTINLRQSQINFNAKKKQQPQQKQDIKQVTSPKQGAIETYYNTHNSVHSSIPCSPQNKITQATQNQITQLTDAYQKGQEIVQIKQQAVTYNKQIPLDIKGKEESNADLIMGGVDERDGGFQFFNDIKARREVQDLNEESSDNDGEISPDGQVLIQNSQRESNLMINQENQRQPTSSTPSQQMNQGIKTTNQPVRNFKHVSSSHNSQASIKAMLAQPLPIGFQENTWMQGSQAIGSGLVVKRTPRTGIKSPKTSGRTEFSAQTRGQRISTKHLNARASANGANLIYTSKDGGFKRTFTQGGHRNQPHPGVLPKIDIGSEKAGNTDRRSSFIKQSELEQNILSIGGQPKLDDFNENRNENQPDLGSSQLNAQSSIQPRTQQALLAIQAKRNAHNAALANTYKNPLEIKSSNQTRRKLKSRGAPIIAEDKVVSDIFQNTQGPSYISDGVNLANNGGVRASRTGNAQSSTQGNAPGYASFNGNNNGSRNKFVYQQPQVNKLSQTQSMNKPQTATKKRNQIEGAGMVQSPPPAQAKKPTISPRQSFQQTREAMSIKTRSNQSSKIRTHTSESNQPSRQAAVEAQIKDLKRVHGITNQELDKKIDEQLELQQHNRMSRAEASELQNWGKGTTHDEAIKSTNANSRTKRGSQLEKTDLYDQAGFSEKEKSRPVTRGDISSPPIGRNKAEIGLGATEYLPGKHNRRISKDIEFSQVSNQNSSNQTQIHSATHNYKQSSKMSKHQGPKLSGHQTAAKPGRGPSNFPTSNNSRIVGGHRGSHQRRDHRKSTASAIEGSEPQTNPGTDAQQKDSERKVVVKNLIIQNSNLQNCNVYIGGDPDQKELTIVSKDDDHRQTPNHYSAQQQCELSPLLPDDKNKGSRVSLEKVIKGKQFKPLIGRQARYMLQRSFHRSQLKSKNRFSTYSMKNGCLINQERTIDTFLRFIALSVIELGLQIRCQILLDYLKQKIWEVSLLRVGVNALFFRCR